MLETRKHCQEHCWIVVRNPESTLYTVPGTSHKVLIYRAPQCMSPRRKWDSPNPSPASECALPPGPKGGGAHSPAAKGVKEFQFRRLEKSLALWPLPTLCLWYLRYLVCPLKSRIRKLRKVPGSLYITLNRNGVKILNQILHQNWLCSMFPYCHEMTLYWLHRNKPCIPTLKKL